MKKRKHRISSYEELISHRYGHPHRSHHDKKYPAKPVVLAKSFDNGETILQQVQPDNAIREYEVSYSAALPEPEEYLVENGNWAAQQSVEDIKYEMVPPSKDNARQEWQVDLMNPLPDYGNKTDTTAPATDIDKLLGAVKAMEAEVLPDEETDKSKLKASDADFLADMKSILSGQTVYDPTLKKTIGKEQLGKQPPSTASSIPVAPVAPGDYKNEHAIFDRIAQSMQYANAYDMGTLELENRFSDFDRINDQEKKTEPRNPTSTAQSLQSSTVDSQVSNTDFIRDLDEIRKEARENIPELPDLNSIRAELAQTDEVILPTETEPSWVETGKTVIGTDDRVAVPNTLITPYRWVCKVDPTFKHPDTGAEISLEPGTGLVVGPRHILTAAHVIETFIRTRGATNKADWQKALKIKITPGSNGNGHQPFGSYETSKFFVLPNWSVARSEDNRHEDFAIIELNEDIGHKKFDSIGNLPLGFFGDFTNGEGTHFSTVVPQMVKDVDVETAGYPHDKPDVQLGKQWKARGRIQPFPNDDPVFLHSMDTGVGQSGSPIWKQDGTNNARYLIGIHNGSITNAQGTNNFGVMMTTSVINQVVKWCGGTNNN